MRSQTKILLGTLALAALWEVGSRVPAALSSMQTFRVRTVDFRGLHFVTRADALADMKLSPTATVWTSTHMLAERLEADPMIRTARVTRRIPSTLIVDVVERHPIALVPTPTLVPIDAHGMRLPIDPAVHHLDLPIMESVDPPAPGARLLPKRSRRLAAEVGRLVEADTAFHQMLSVVSETSDQTVRARWSNPPVEFLLRLDTPPRKLREGLVVLADALGRDPGHPPSVIDLRYADQVVVRRSR